MSCCFESCFEVVLSLFSDCLRIVFGKYFEDV